MDNNFDILFFFGQENYLSNWYPSEFNLFFGERECKFYNVEQAMMASKAMLFKDMESFNKILKTPNPRSVKRLGRKVKNFDPSVWDKYKKYIVKAAVYSKFKNNQKLRYELFSTGTKYLAEDSSADKVWGIGTKSKKHKENKTWTRQNLLGIILMEVRETLKQGK